MIKEIKEGIKEDLRTIKAMAEGKAEPRIPLRDMISPQTFKKHLGTLLLLLLAFCCGFYVASQYYQVQANNFIVEFCLANKHDWVLNANGTFVNITGLFR